MARPGSGAAMPRRPAAPHELGSVRAWRTLVHFGVARDEVFKVHELTLEPQTGISACHARCRHGVEPERRFRSNRKKYHEGATARKRSDTVGEITIRRQSRLYFALRLSKEGQGTCFCPD